MPRQTVTVNLPPGESIRIDAWVASTGLLTRSQIKSRCLTVSDRDGAVKLSRKVRGGETFELGWDDPEPMALEGEEIPLSILYEDETVLVIDKPQGLVVHPGCGNRAGTLVNGLIHYIEDLKDDFDDDVRPGIVHRLDRDTSGVIVAVKTARALEFLARQFHDRLVKKEYLAVVKGVPSPSTGLIDTFIGRDPGDRKKFKAHDTAGKKSVTRYRVERSWPGYALVRLFPETGRTHQLRVHMKHIGHPIVGDPIYSRKDNRFPEATLMLHAEVIRILLPSDNEIHEFHAPVPQRFSELTACLDDPTLCPPATS
jgi:23S rRNA pseudouridine1911/1915/1917 synthase